MIGATYLVWLLLIPLFFSLTSFLARWLGRVSRVVVEGSHVLSISLVLALSLPIIYAVYGSGDMLTLGGWLYLDSLGAIFLLIISTVGFLAGMYSLGYTRNDLKTGELTENQCSTYYSLFSLFLFTMLLVVTANNIIMMWVAVEATTLGSTFLIGIYRKQASLEAAWKYIVICTVGVAFGLYGTILVYSDAFNVMRVPNNAVLWTEIVKNASALDPSMIKMALVFVLVGFGTKAGLFPMHTWLPDANSEAPSPISAMLSGVLENCALLIVFRFATISNLVLGPGFVQILFLIFGTLTIAAACFFMYTQRDIKRLLAYSSMENVGLIVFAFGLGGPAGIFAGLLHAINHSLVKALMFCMTGNITIKYQSRSLDQVKGLLQSIPFTSGLLIVGAFAIVGLPPFNIFVSKFLIIAVGIGSGYLWLVTLCLLLLIIVFVAFFRAITSSVFGEKPSDVGKGESNWLTLLPGAFFLMMILILGIYIPPQLASLLNGAGSVILTGNPGQPNVLVTMNDIFPTMLR